MATTAKDIIRRIQEENIQMVDFKMVDINGQYRHVTIPARNFTESTTTFVSKNSFILHSVF